MKINRLLYIGSILLLAGCTSETDFSNTLSGNGKTPLMIEATLNTGRAQTRASGKDFASGDQLLSYVRHITGGDAINNYTYISTGPDYANKLVTYTKGSTAMSVVDANTNQTSDLTSTAYWDDFSRSDAAATDLRTSGHGLQSYYGYCYNGGTPSTNLVENTGVLGWTVQTNQSSEASYRRSDLLWSPTQTKVVYAHAATHGADHGTMTIPYTHALSQISVTVIATEGFEGSPLTSTGLTLIGMNTTTTLTAPVSTWTPVDGTSNINMFPGAYSSGLRRTFTAIVAPGTQLKKDNQLLIITNADGNNYEVIITTDMLDDTNGWGKNHESPKQGTDGSGKKYIITQPGYNYHLDVTIRKSAVQAHSTLTDWTDVTAEAEGDIYFPEDDIKFIMDDYNYPGSSTIDIMTIDKDEYKHESTFSLFRLQSTGSNTNSSGEPIPDTRPNDSYEFVSISQFKNNGVEPDDIWTNTPELYWPNNSYKFYFRALAKYNIPDTEGTYAGKASITSIGNREANPVDKGTNVSQGTVAEGHDILWGTTPKHYGYSYNRVYKRGYAIPPRTHGVPIVFEHAMSKIGSITLTTTDEGSPLPTNAMVNLTGANITINNISTEGIIRLDDGKVTNMNEKTDVSSSSVSFNNLIVIPQDFSTESPNAMVTITLPNESDAVYTIPLKECVVDGTSTKITAWERGKVYAYTIHLEKERVQFKVLVKDWDNVVASGNAGLNWQALGANE